MTKKGGAKPTPRLKYGLMMTGGIWSAKSVRSNCAMNPLKPRHLSEEMKEAVSSKVRQRMIDNL